MNEADRQRHETEYRAIAAAAWDESRGEGEPSFAKLPNPDFRGQLVADARAVLETGSAGPQRRAFQEAVKRVAERLANPAEEVNAERAGLHTPEGDAARAAAAGADTAVHADQLVSSVPQDGIDPALLHADTSNEARVGVEPVHVTDSEPATPTPSEDALTLRNADPADPADDEAVSAAASRLSALAHADDEGPAGVNPEEEATAEESPAV